MTITQHALLYNFHTSNLFCEEIFFLKFLSMQPLLTRSVMGGGVMGWEEGFSLSLVYHYAATEGLVRSRFPPKNHCTIL